MRRHDSYHRSIFAIPLLALALNAISTIGCAGSSVEEASSGDDSLRAAAGEAGPITASELGGSLDRAHLRATNPDLDDTAFQLKWAAAKKDALSFFRSFDAAYHADLAGVPVARVPGKETLCAGDAHQENFGFMKLPSGTRFAVNDFDDAGYCPAAFDAARFFAAISLGYGDDALTKQVLERYVDTLKDASKAKTIDSDLAPSWKKKHEKGLSKYTKNGAFVLDDETKLSAPDSADRAAVVAAVSSDSRLGGATVRDVADYERVNGGSGGLRRIWVLADVSSTRTILELKELTSPGVTWGRHTRTLEPSARFDTLKRTFWGDADPGDVFTVSLLGETFMLRDRLVRDAPDLGDLSAGDRSKVLEVEASQLAILHTSAFSEVKKDALRTWLSGTAQTLATRWKKAWSAARSGP
ncbi:DUF2252 domain-containing protein [Pendulispora brunnea]|uniref:DUF2252 domain-containing protein n=1 Tax=Pendulispora brunnea TaxID=2905690 RepID=A0ABZ2JY62_9BACT